MGKCTEVPDYHNQLSRHQPSSSLQPPMPHRAAACPASPNRSGSTLSTKGGAAAFLARQMRQVPSNEADSRASGSQGWKSTKAVGPACPTSTDTGRPGRPSPPCWAEREGAFLGRVVMSCCGGSTRSAPACRRPDLWLGYSTRTNARFPHCPTAKAAHLQLPHANGAIHGAGGHQGVVARHSQVGDFSIVAAAGGLQQARARGPDLQIKQGRYNRGETRGGAGSWQRLKTKAKACMLSLLCRADAPLGALPHMNTLPTPAARPGSSMPVP